jgi:hypothetical protein
LVGPAGTGKSRALDAARLAWEQSGYDPIGLAPSAMAASVLTDEAGLRSETLAKFLFETSRGTSSLRLDRRSDVVLDEAGLARSDDLANLLAAVEHAKAKLVLVGDPHQLGSVGPGGIYRTLVADHGAHELETVRRFHHAWEAAASLRLRARDPAILAAYLRHERIADGSREQMIHRAFGAWRDAREEGSSILLMAGDNATADELSRRCRAELVSRGWVGRDGVRIAAGVAGYGDEVVTLQNDRRLRTSRGDFVRNGARWRVIGTSDDGSMRVVESDRGGTVTLPPEYVSEHVTLGYAVTVHKAQGQTTDRAIVLVDVHMTAAQLYVAMSRGREENRAFVTVSDDAPEDHVHRPSLDGIEVLATVMRRDEVDRSAHDVMRRGFARYEDLALLNDLYEEANHRITQSAGLDHREEIAALEPRANVQAATEQLHEAEDAIRRAEEQRDGAETRVAEAQREPIRARLPGRIGEGSRCASQVERRDAEQALVATRRAEQAVLREYEAARYRLTDTKAAATELAALRTAQERRESWMREHPDELQWARALQERIDARTREGIGLATRADRDVETEQVPGDRNQPRTARAQRTDARPTKPRTKTGATRQGFDAATEAVLRRSSRSAPKSARRLPEREGPVRER